MLQEYIYIHTHVTHTHAHTHTHVRTHARTHAHTPGRTVCANLLRLVVTILILKILSRSLDHLFPLSFSPRQVMNTALSNNTPIHRG